MERIPFETNEAGLILHVQGNFILYFLVPNLVLVLSARGIKPSCLGRDSFAELLLNDKAVSRTRIISRNNHPHWNEEIQVLLSEHPAQDLLQAFVYGKHWYGKEFLGRVVIPVSLLLTTTHDSWFKLLPKNRFVDPRNTTPGFLHLNITLEQANAPHAPVVPQMQPAAPQVQNLVVETKEAAAVKAPDLIQFTEPQPIPCASAPNNSPVMMAPMPSPSGGQPPLLMYAMPGDPRFVVPQQVGIVFGFL